MELFCSLLPGHRELYHYHLLWIHGPYIYIWWEVWTCYFLKEMLCEFLGLPSFESSWIRSTGWYLLSCLFLSPPLSLSWWTSTNLFVDLSLSPAHEYGAIWNVLVTLYDTVFVQHAGAVFWKLPLCHICRKEQQVVHGSEKKTQLKWL